VGGNIRENEGGVGGNIRENEGGVGWEVILENT
jgi:hypothetical protein